MAWGAVAGAVIGGVMSNKAAKKSAAASRYATDQQMAGFNLAKPYIEAGYKGGQEGLNYSLDKGAYSGDTYANMNNMSNAGYNYMNNFGMGQQGNAQNFMNQGANYGNNFNDLYNKAGQDNLGAANAYAVNNSQGLINSAMRDSTRQLNEQTLPAINMAATSSGNVNSSRAGVADAIARRSYDDRMADTTSNIQNNLSNQYLNQNQNQFANQMNANQQLGGVYNQGFGMGNQISGMMTGAGGAFQADAQNQMNTDKAQFEDDRDFQLNQYNKYMSGIMGKAPMTTGQITPNLYNPQMSGLMGAMQGFGMGGKIQDAFNNRGGGNNFTAGDITNYKTDPYGAMGTGNPTYGFG
jgi:hypothetical protein